MQFLKIHVPDTKHVTRACQCYEISQDVHMCGSIEIHVVKFIGHCAVGKWDMW
jgi:hypothetical protein